MDRRSFLKRSLVASAAYIAACGDDESANNSRMTPTPGPDAGLGVDADVDVDMGAVDMDEGEEVLPELDDYAWEGELGPETLFSHGVASGDPLADSVILWTRVSPEADGEVEVWWEIAYDIDFERRLQVGTVTTSAERDYTVKIDVSGLRAERTFYYRFFVAGRQSTIGRTRTAPRNNARQIRFAICSCSNYTVGYFHAYRHIAQQADLDVVLHLGDYIYETRGNAGGEDDERVHEPRNETISLDDYRMRYANYRRDPDLQAVHQQHPFIVVWDDHESANDAWIGGAQNHSDTEGPWADRVSAAVQAYFEWMPIRESITDRAEGQIYRKLSYGGLAEFIMLDTRLWGREEQSNTRSVREAIGRQLLGLDQEMWFFEQVRSSQAQWKFVGQQVMMGQFKSRGLPNAEGGGSFVNGDQWDGYRDARRRFLSLLDDAQIDDVVVLTGDIHTSWAIDLAADPNNDEAYDPDSGQGSLAVEFVTPGITSRGLVAAPAIQTNVLTQNPHIQWIDLERRGYVLFDCTRERLQGAWYHVDDVTSRQGKVEFAVAYSTATGNNHLVVDSEPAPGKPNPPALAPSPS